MTLLLRGLVVLVLAACRTTPSTDERPRAHASEPRLDAGVDGPVAAAP